MITATLKGFKGFSQRLSAEQKKEEKALEIAIKVEGFQLRKTLQKEIRAGSPGGQRFDDQTFISRFVGGKRRQNKPLRRLAIAVRYKIDRKPFGMAIGWPDTVSKSWRRIAKKQQEGFTQTVTNRMKTWMRSYLGKESKVPKKYKRYFMVKNATKIFTTPARPIIAPFWSKYQHATWRNIKRNWSRKARGKSI